MYGGPLVGHDDFNGTVILVLPWGSFLLNYATCIYISNSTTILMDDFELSLGYKVDLLVPILIEFVANELRNMFEILNDICILFLMVTLFLTILLLGGLLFSNRMFYRLRLPFLLMVQDLLCRMGNLLRNIHQNFG